MDHQELKDKLFLMHDRELPDPERLEVLAHVERCAECREHYQQWQNIAGTLFPAVTLSADDQFIAGVMARVHALGPACEH